MPQSRAGVGRPRSDGTTVPSQPAPTPAAAQPVPASSASRKAPLPGLRDELIVGRLKSHGPAKHEFRPKAEPSYFVLIHAGGKDTVLWSPKLERALARAQTQPKVGDQVGIRKIEIVPIAPQTAGSAGSKAKPITAPRSYWVIERVEFFAERAAAATALRDATVHPRDAVRDHPDLLGAYFAIESAQKVAQHRIVNPESRDRFVTLVREALAHAAERGEPLPASRPRLEAAETRSETKNRPPARAEGERTR